MKNNFLLFAVIALITAIYPIVIYYGLNEYGPRVLALILLIILLLRSLSWKAFKVSERLFYLFLVGSLCALAAWFESEKLLRFYPVLMNFGVAMFFYTSLWIGRPLIERFASFVVADLSTPALRYMRKLTLVWALLLTINGLISSYTACCLPLKQWAFYNGVVAYLVFGSFSLLELIVRYFYKKRNPA